MNSTLQHTKGKPHKLSRVTILNTYSWFNKGDTAIVLGTAQALRALNPDVEITIVSVTPEIDDLRYRSSGIRVIGGPFRHLHESSAPRFQRSAHFVLNALAAAVGALKVRLLGRGKLNWLPRDAREFVQAITEADLAISCGGGFWSDNVRRALYLHLYQVILALLVGAPVICLGQTLGPFRSRWRGRLTGWVLDRTDAVVLREHESLPVARAIKIRPDKVWLGADMAFALSAAVSGSADPSRPGRELQVGVTARAWLFPKSADPRTAQLEYERELAKAIDLLIERHNCRVTFLPQVIGPGSDDDRIIEQRILGQLRYRAQAVLLDEDLSPEELIRYIRNLDFVIATRFHSAIFSMLAQVPVVAIAYEHKTTGIMAHMGLDEWVIPIEDVTATRVTQLFNRLVQDGKEVRAQLQRAVEQECNQAYASVQRVL